MAAEPGVSAGGRTLAVASGRAAWDLDATSAHPATLWPSRDATVGAGDASGCAGDSESRAGRGGGAGSSERWWLFVLS